MPVLGGRPWSQKDFAGSLKSYLEMVERDAALLEDYLEAIGFW
jgi:hypothetical protein